MSLASFFPEELPSRPMDAARLYSKAQENSNRSDYVSAGERFWRISARVQGESTSAKEKAFRELGEMMVGEPVHLTGIAPLLEHAQREIFQGFWESFLSAFLVITGIMALAFRSPVLAVVAMLPNLFPIAVVFGLMGWMGMSVDIGITMTASIALGIAVDGTFHYVITYQKRLRDGMSGDRAAWNALVHNGEPILQAAIITSMGMLALTSSSFSPTVRFGWLMATILMVAVIGDLVFLPALVSFRIRRRGRIKKNRAAQTLEAAPVPELASRKSAA
jgi:predicted RND superfamily exporter protein